MTNSLPGVNTDVDIADVNGFPEAMQAAIPIEVSAWLETLPDLEPEEPGSLYWHEDVLVRSPLRYPIDKAEIGRSLIIA